MTTLSLLLCLATAALWTRSYWNKQQLFWGSKTGPAYSQTLDTLASERGALSYSHESWTTPAHPFWTEGFRFSSAPLTSLSARPRATATPAANPQRRLGFGWDRHTLASAADNQVMERDIRIIAPHWFVFAVTGMLPVRWLVGWLLAMRRRRLRDREGLCVNCGYDLRATPGRCPECGAESNAVAAQGRRNTQQIAEKVV